MSLRPIRTGSAIPWHSCPAQHGVQTSEVAIDRVPPLEDMRPGTPLSSIHLLSGMVSRYLDQQFNSPVHEEQTSLLCTKEAGILVCQWWVSLHDQRDACYGAITLLFNPEALRCYPFLCNLPSLVEFVRFRVAHARCLDKKKTPLNQRDTTKATRTATATIHPASTPSSPPSRSSQHSSCKQCTVNALQVAQPAMLTSLARSTNPINSIQGPQTFL